MFILKNQEHEIRLLLLKMIEKSGFQTYQKEKHTTVMLMLCKRGEGGGGGGGIMLELNKNNFP